MGLLDLDMSAVNGKKPRKSDRQMNGEDVLANAKANVSDGLGLLADFTPVVGGVKGAYEEAKAGNPVMSAINAATVPLDVISAGGAGALMKGLLGAGMIKNVWHGSPHKFDKFDMSKIGTGEGAQAYGHGIYGAEAKDVAQTYQPRDPKLEQNLMAKYSQAERQGNYPAMQVYEDYLLHKTPTEIEALIPEYGYSGKDLAQVQAAHEYAKKQYFDQKAGHLYKTNLVWPDPAKEAATPLGIDDFLHWDKPLSEQSPQVKAALQNSQVQLGPLQQRARAADFERDPYKTGEDLYKQLASRLVPDGSPDIWRGSTPISGQGDLVRQHLTELGIPGIRYLDGGSRGVGQGSYNYVLFDDKIPQIVERNGKPVGGLLE